MSVLIFLGAVLGIGIFAGVLLYFGLQPKGLL